MLFIRFFSFLVLILASLEAKGGLAEAINHPKLQQAIEKNIKYQWNVAAAIIFQDEAPYLKEWIEYHRLLGVEHFYMYNNLSQDNYREVLSPYVKKGIVELIDWPFESIDVSSFDQIQILSYQDAHQRALGKVKWLAILDADEFLVPIKEDNLSVFLSHYEDPSYAYVIAFWVVFGTSNVAKIPENALMIEMLLRNGGQGHGLYKHIMRPERVEIVNSPHHSLPKPGFKTISLSFEEMQINHYWCRDEDYLYNQKIPRREKWGTSKETVLYWANAQNNETPAGDIILRFVPELRKRMSYD